MPRETKIRNHRTPWVRSRTRARVALCAVPVLALCPVLLSLQMPSGFSVVSQARAQQLPDAATQELFLAVDRNDLIAVRAAVDKGADIEARDYTGTQPVDMAIDRGYFDIAHYLISVRNAAQAQQSGEPAQPVPSAEELAQSQSLFQAPPPPQAPAVQTPEVQTPEPQATVSEMAQPEPPQVENDPFVVTVPSASLADAEPKGETSPQNQQNPGQDVARIKPEPTPDPVSEPISEPMVQTQPPAPAIEVVTPQQAKTGTTEKKAKPSATKRFITTFLDFFKPPNVTGVTRREKDRKQTTASITDEELAKQLREIDAERGDAVIQGPEVPISPEELVRQLPPSPDIPDLTPEEIAALQADTPDLPPYAVSAPGQDLGQDNGEPMPAPEDAFGDLQIEDISAADEQPLETPKTDASSPPPTPGVKQAPGVPGKAYDPNKPFGGGVDPDVLAFLGLDARTGRPIDGAPEDAQAQQTAEDDPFASPFEMLDGAKEPAVSDLLEGLGKPQDVASKSAKSPPAPGDDPFATPPPQPGGEVDELAGLLESTGESVNGTKGWDVTKVEGADLPDQVATPTEIEPTGHVLDGVELALGADTVLGQEVGEARLKLLDQESIHKPCIAKNRSETVFCIDTVSWPFELEENFLVDTIMYQGTRAVARYDAGRATNFHTLFRTAAFKKVIAYYTKRYGQPTQVIQRAIAPLAAPRQENPTYLWQSREPGTDTITTLEIREFDDALPGFPDTRSGVILLYRSHAKPIFPQLSQLELMVLKADGTPAPSGGAGATSPGDIWN